MAAVRESIYHDGSTDVFYGRNGGNWYFPVKNVQLMVWTSNEVVDGEWINRAPIRDAKFTTVPTHCWDDLFGVPNHVVLF
jgi:hypothetical protein